MYEYKLMRKSRDDWERLANNRLKLIQKKNRIIRDLKTNGK